MDDFASLPIEQRRDVLLALPKSAEPIMLSAVGLEPADQPLYVMSTEDDLVAGTQIQCLAAAALALGMAVFDEPILVQGGNDAPDTYEVWADMGGTATRLASATTRGEALAILKANLEMLAGHTAMPLADWVALQNSDPFSDAAEAKARRGVQWAHSVMVELVGKPLKDGWINWTLDIPTESERVRHKQARKQLMEPGSLRRLKESRTVRRYEVRAIELDGDLYANFHDLSRAARNGVDVSALRPWPYFSANAFVISREYQRYLRSQGWRMLWAGEEEQRSARQQRNAGGAHWLRDDSAGASA